MLNPEDTMWLSEGIIHIAGRIDRTMEERVHKLLESLESQGSPDVEIRICSQGGDAGCGLGICNAIDHYEGTTTGVASIWTYSTATIILQSCNKRVALGTAQILISNPETDYIPDALASEEERDVVWARLQDDKQKMYTMLSQRTGTTMDAIDIACEQKKEMSATEALDFGLIDEIRTCTVQRKSS